VKIHLHGTEEECREVAERLAGIVKVLAISESYPDREASVLVRVYVEARIARPCTSPAPPSRGRAAAAGPPAGRCLG
jgi:hypothetical protein